MTPAAMGAARRGSSGSWETSAIRTPTRRWLVLRQNSGDPGGPGDNWLPFQPSRRG